MAISAGENRSFPRAPSGLAGERRQVTAFFYDIVGSTQLLHAFDPEEFGLVQRRVHSLAAASIQEQGGHLDTLRGDGGAAYFGYPAPSETAAESAVAAGLDLVSRCRALQESGKGPLLQVRVGIATGMVIISDFQDSALPGGWEVIGITPALAARLQSEAEPDSVVVADATFRLTRGAFAFEPLGQRTLKGFAEAVQIWRPTGRRSHGVRFASSRHPMTPLVGRDAELERLRHAWAETREGRGQVLTVVGEAGIGKSRLVAEFSQEVKAPEAPGRGRTGDVRVFQCLPRGNARPLHPFIDSLHRLIRGETAGSPSLSVEEVDAFMRHGGVALEPDETEVIAFLSGGPGNRPADRLADRPGEETRRLALDAAFTVLAAWAARRPQVIVVEDTHWADTMTRSLIAEAADRLAGLPVLVLLTSRQDDEGVPPRPNATTVALGRLDAQTAPRMIASLWGGPPPQGFASFVHHKSDGVPLFAEELAILLKERFLQGDSDARDWDRALRESGIVTLQDLLSARLSGLGPARRIAQLASVIGREFGADLLARVLEREEPALSLDEALAHLLRSGIIRRTHEESDAAYRFRHVLLQEAAYDSLLKSDRRELHGRVADLAPRQGGSVLPDDVMAWHCDQAGRPRDAAGYALRAAESCSARSAVREAEGLLAFAEDLIGRCEPGPDADELSLQLLAARGPVVIALSGKGSPEARAVYDQGVALCRRQEVAGERERWFPLYWGWWYTSPDRITKKTRSQVLIDDLDRANDPEIRLQSFHCAWAANYHVGHHDVCMDCIDEGLKLYDPDQGRVSRARYGGHDAKVCGLGERAHLLWLMGDRTGAQASMRQSLEWAESIDHLGSLCHALDYAALFSVYCRDLAQTAAFASRMHLLAETHGLPEVHAKSRIFGGWATALQGAFDTGFSEFLQGLEAQQAVGSDEDWPVYRSLWAELLIRAGQEDRALVVLNEAIQDAQTSGNAVWLPELYRMRARTRGPAVNPDASVQDLESAIRLAEEQGAATLAALARADLDRARQS
ncbi:AAA family ATPase [Microvirga pudoricolor]|uniref:AAA family ATPase n=1 Tax=Microvirga pudoricolor TaxID=2778729 RepID=UPI00194FEB69|nr:AAA family ATPase [Microvirga pudoricolor]MBM6594042.1 AAA family ATPase [Microvirga pudoricolor]